jgi:hypothetical protein
MSERGVSSRDHEVGVAGFNPTSDALACFLSRQEQAAAVLGNVW